eukprot:1237905-Amphidinium_carterae.1
MATVAWVPTKHLRLAAYRLYSANLSACCCQPHAARNEAGLIAVMKLLEVLARNAAISVQSVQSFVHGLDTHGVQKQEVKDGC